MVIEFRHCQDNANQMKLFENGGETIAEIQHLKLQTFQSPDLVIPGRFKS